MSSPVVGVNRLISPPALRHRPGPFRKVLQRGAGVPPIDADERITATSVGGRHVLLLCKKGASKDWSVPPDGDGELHVAFAIPRNQFQDWERRLAEHGVSIEHRPGSGADKASIFATLTPPLGEPAMPGVWSVY
jgi:hypothetical protein